MSFAVDLSASPSPQGARLVAVDGRALPLVAASLDVDARGGLARVVLTQTFRNPWDEPLTVHYSLPLPHDGAVSGFEFVLGQDRVVGEIDRRENARARYEEALATGRSAALLQQDRGALFTQEIANVPPETDLVARITVDQRLRWRDEGAWEWRFPTVVAPRYLGAEGRLPDADRITQDVADGPLPLRMDLALRVRDRLEENAVATSPSHAIATSTAEDFASVCLRSADGRPAAPRARGGGGASRRDPAPRHERIDEWCAPRAAPARGVGGSRHAGRRRHAGDDRVLQ